MDAKLTKLFDAYEKAYSALDFETTAGFFADTFISAGPKGTIAQNKSEFKSKGKQAADFYRSVGLEYGKILSTTETSIADHHSIVEVHWGVKFRKTGAKLIEFDVGRQRDRPQAPCAPPPLKNSRRRITTSPKSEPSIVQYSASADLWITPKTIRLLAQRRMIRVRQGLETDTDAGLAKEAERAGNGDALQPMQGPQEAVANATVDGGPVILWERRPNPFDKGQQRDSERTAAQARVMRSCCRSNAFGCRS